MDRSLKRHDRILGHGRGRSEGGLEELVRCNVGCELGDSADPGVMGLEIRVSSEETSVLAKTVDCLTDLPHNNIDEGQSASNEVIVGAEAVSKGCDGLHSLGDGFVTVLASEGNGSDAREEVGDNVLEHENLSFLCDVGTEEFRSILLTDVEGDCLGLSQLEVSIDDIWQVGEVESTTALHGGPRFLIVLPVLEVDSLEVEDVTVDATAGTSPDGPVSENES